MGKKSFSRNCLQGKTLPVSWRPYFRKIKRIPENVIAAILPRVLCSLSARARPRKWREQVSARSLYYSVYRLLFTQKGLSHFKYDTLYSQSQLLRILHSLKDSVNALKKVHQMTLSLHFHFFYHELWMWRSASNWPSYCLRLNWNFIDTILFFLFKSKHALILFHANSNRYQLKVSQW